MHVTCVAVCPVWEVREDMHGEGASEHGEVENVGECQEACLADPDCVGFDLERDDLICWLHSDPDNFDPPQELPGVDLHILTERCPSSNYISVP